MNSNRLPLGHETGAWLPCMHEMAPQPHAGADIADSLVAALTSRNLHCDSEFSRRAIESLVRKQPTRQGANMLLALIEHERANMPVTDVDYLSAPCLLLERSRDGRMQVANRKGFPHLIYARIWRWPEVDKQQLAGMCDYAYEKRKDYVCVNPFHYTRITPGTRWCSVTILKPTLGAATEHISTEYRAICIVFNASMPAAQSADTRQIIVSFLGTVGSEPLIGHILIIRGGDVHAPMNASGVSDEVMLANNSNYTCVITNMLDTIQCTPTQQIPLHLHKVNNRPLAVHVGECVIEVQLHSNASTAAMMRAHS